MSLLSREDVAPSNSGGAGNAVAHRVLEATPLLEAVAAALTGEAQGPATMHCLLHCLCCIVAARSKGGKLPALLVTATDSQAAPFVKHVHPALPAHALTQTACTPHSQPMCAIWATAAWRAP